MPAQIDRFFKDGEMFSFYKEIMKPFEDLIIRVVDVREHTHCYFCKQAIIPDSKVLSLTYYHYGKTEGPFIAHERCICMFSAQKEGHMAEKYSELAEKPE
jgi:hypothetical protein